ncbi:MAG: hypothetical protein QHH07_12655 [Sedimentisphaerales bacterium]|nr:hypothetical protein [Sedimentisphaerales bacterium]
MTRRSFIIAVTGLVWLILKDGLKARVCSIEGVWCEPLGAYPGRLVDLWTVTTEGIWLG